MWEVRIESSDSSYKLTKLVNELCEKGWEPMSLTRSISGMYDQFSIMLRRKKETK